MLLINFKAYSQAIGDKAMGLAEAVEKIRKDTGKEIAVVPNFIDLKDISKVTKVFAPHMDPLEPGAHTAHVTYEMIPFCEGIVLNHSENQIALKEIDSSVKIAKKAGLKTVVCANDVEAAKKIAVFEPDYIAVEPPELIGGDISVSKAKPEIVSGAVKSVKSISKSKVLVGAGVKSKDDVSKAVELGADGIFVASGIVKADNPEAVIREMVEPL